MTLYQRTARSRPEAVRFRRSSNTRLVILENFPPTNSQFKRRPTSLIQFQTLRSHTNDPTQHEINALKDSSTTSRSRFRLDTHNANSIETNLCFTESHRMDFKETASSSGRKLRKNFTGSGERSASSEIIRYREDE